MKTRMAADARRLFEVGIVAVWSGVGGAGYYVSMKSALIGEGLFWWFILGAVIWGIIQGAVQSMLLSRWWNNDRAFVLKWLRASVIGWSFVGGFMGGILVIVIQVTYAIIWGGFDALFWDPPTWVGLLSGIVGSTWLQTRVMRRKFKNFRQWWQGSLLGWGGGFLVFLGLNHWPLFAVPLTDALSGLAAGIVAGIITGITLMRMAMMPEPS